MKEENIKEKKEEPLFKKDKITESHIKKIIVEIFDKHNVRLSEDDPLFQILRFDDFLRKDTMRKMFQILDALGEFPEDLAETMGTSYAAFTEKLEKLHKEQQNKINESQKEIIKKTIEIITTSLKNDLELLEKNIKKQKRSYSLLNILVIINILMTVGIAIISGIL